MPRVKTPRAGSWPLVATASTRDRLASAVAGLAPAVVLGAAPYERLDRALVLPGQTLTNVEGVTAAALGSWLLALVLLRRRPVWQTPATGPLAVLIVALVVAALLAPADRTNAFKGAGRFVAGALVALVTLNAAPTAARAMPVLAAGLASGAVVAGIAILEALQRPGLLRWLSAFRPGVHVVGGELRASGTLLYPTIASMYLEIVFALGLALLVVAVDRRRWWSAGLILAALALAAEAIALTLTRAGGIALAVAVGLVLAGLARRRGPRDPAVRLVATLGVLTAIAVGATWTTRAGWLRLASETTAGWYRAEYDVPPRLGMRPGETRRIDVRVRNAGRVPWRPEGTEPFRLSYHWLAAATDRVVQFDGLRTALPGRVPPGAWSGVSAWVRAPATPGRYRLAWDIVQEHRLWFSTEGSPPGLTDVEVVGAPLADASSPPPDTAYPSAKVVVGRRTLWRAALAIVADHPLTGVGPDNFRLRYGPYAGVERADPRLHSNNMYLELFAGAGLPGGLAFLWFLWRVGRRLATATLAADGDGLVIRLGVGAALAVTVVHGLVDSFLTFTPTYLAIWIAVGLAVRGGDPTGGWDRADHR